MNELTTQLSLFGLENFAKDTKRKRMVGEVLCIPNDIASDFLIQRHYSGRIPTISKAFGWYVGGGT